MESPNTIQSCDPRSFIALHDFKGDDDNQLSIKANEEVWIFIDNDNGEWCCGQLQSGETGWLPRSYIAPIDSLNEHSWYHGEISRSRAETILNSATNGSFLVRESECDAEYSLSMRFDDRPWHYKIMKNSNGKLYISDVMFATLAELVHHHSQHAGGLATTLHYSAPKSEKPTTGGTHEPDEWEIDRDKICMKRRFNVGRYSDLYEGLWTKHGRKVAVKTLKTMVVDDFLREANLMKKFKHNNLVQLIGVCTRDDPFCIIMEFMQGGNLLDYLRNIKKSKDIDATMLVHFAVQVASAMTYLKDKKFVHRDLKARNCLLAINNVLKVGNFGLSRPLRNDKYNDKLGSEIPIKWTAPEALQFNEFTVKSDVWAFGVLLWELTTYGIPPYPCLEEAQVYDTLSTGYRMPAPVGCPDKIYELMKKCWAWDQMDRPSFADIYMQLNDMFNFYEEIFDDESLSDTIDMEDIYTVRWESLETLNTTQSCDPHSLNALNSSKGDDDVLLSIKANKEVLILSDNGDGERSRVQLQNGQTVFLPQNNIAPIDSSDKHPWYHGRMSRIRAETILNSEINGNFLVRESQSNADELRLCVRFDDRPYHYKIMKSFDGKFYICDDMMFATLAELVHHHSQRADGLVTTLHYPAPHYPAPKSEKPTTGGTHEPDQWEIDRAEICIKQRFNEGHYSDVYEALWTKHQRKVAVETFKEETMEVDDFLREANLMKKLNHKNLVQLIGVCTREAPIYIIMEYLEGGNLLTYLRDGKKSKDPDAAMLKNFATQVASAMMYLEEMKLIHRDLAARSCLLDGNNVVKLGNFYMLRPLRGYMYTARPGYEFPIKWMAPETLEFEEFTDKSDVWAFGVLLWELATYGKTPYPFLRNAHVYDKISTGYRMRAPEGCQDEVYQLMKKCWAWHANDRPSFVDIHRELTNLSETPVPWKWEKRSIVHRQKFINLREYAETHPKEIKEVNGVRVCCSTEFLLGKGSDGTRVYVGLGNDGVEKAVKRLPRDSCSSLAEQEKKILNQLNTVKSKHVVNYWFLDDQSDKDYLFLILDLCEETLENFVERSSETDLVTCAPDIIEQVLKGLVDLHSDPEPILHRDLKPSNILRNVQNNWFLADFGISRILEAGVLIYESIPRGSEYWKAVESCSSEAMTNDSKSNNVRYKKQSDIQVAGMVAFYTVTKGGHPFGAKPDRLRNLLDGKPVGLDTLKDEAAKDLIAWMLQHDPKDRPTAEEALKHPYLQPPKQQFELLCKVGNQQEIKTGDNNSPVVQNLNNDPTDWRNVMTTDVLKYLCTDFINGKPKVFSYKSSWTECLRLIRNVNQHWHDRPRPRPQPEAFYKVGDPQTFFLDLFPSLPVKLHRIIRSCDWKERDDLKEYFTSVRDLYVACLGLVYA